MNQPAVENKEQTKYVKPAWYKKTERLLKWMKYLPDEIDNLRIQLQMDKLAGQRITAQYRSVVGGHSNTVSSPLAAIASRDITLEEKIEYRELLLQMLNNTVNSFNRDEKKVFELRYDLELKDKEVFTSMDMSRSSYFELQKRVILKAAMFLHIPVPLEDQPNAWKGKLFENDLD